MVKAWWFHDTHNIGDRVSPILFKHFLDTDVQLMDDRSKPHLLGVGSILAGAHWYTYIWGSGIMGPEYSLYDLHVQKILALRGRLSRSIVAAKKGKPIDVVLGDPGYLMPLVPGFEPVDCSKKYKLGLIPHYQHWDMMLDKQWHQQEDILLLDVTAEPEEFFSNLQQCQAIASSSLHGLIFAEAYAIPNVWLEFSMPLTGGRFKFEDWFSLAGRPQLNPVIAERSNVDAMILEARLHDMQIDSEALINVLTEHKNEIIQSQIR